MQTNNKEQELYRIVNIVIECCNFEAPDGSHTVRLEDLLGPSRAEPHVMSRCILASHIIRAGYSVNTITALLSRSISTVRHLLKMNIIYSSSSKAYRIASEEVTARCFGAKIGQ